MERAIQWWYDRQSKQLTWEAERIRDCLLQESFAVRRSLELSLLRSHKSAIDPVLNWIEQFQIFHAYLKELSDRLSPPYLEEGLPLAIECLVQKWQLAKPNCKFQLKLTPQWRQNSSDRNRIVLTAVDGILELELSDLKKVVIDLDLQQNARDNQLKITLERHTSHSALSSDKCRELKYLSQSFRILTSGTLLVRAQKSLVSYQLSWSSQLN